MQASIVILNYNTAEDTVALVNKIKGYDVFRQIVVVDNCSADDSYEKLKRIEGGKTHVIRSDHNGGYGAGNNLGIEYAKRTIDPEYIFISNPDVEFSEKCAKAMVNVLERNKELALCAPIMRIPHRKGVPLTAWEVPTFSSEILTNGLFSYEISRRLDITHFYSYKKVMRKSIFPVGCVFGAFFCIKTDIFFEIGLFDTDFFLFCEESVIGYKLRQAGHRSALLTNHHYWHYESVSIDKMTKSLSAKKKLLFDSSLLYMAKYLNAGTVKLCIAKLVYKLYLAEFAAYAFVKSITGRLQKKQTPAKAQHPSR